MKKILLSLLIFVLCFVLVGCSGTSKETEEIINQGNENNEESDIKLYSSEDRLVYNAEDVYYIVVNFGEDDKATSLKWIYDYGDATTAKTMVTIIEASLESDSEVKSVTQDGKYIVVDYEESAYEDMDRTTTAAAFGMYQEVQNNN